MTKKAIKPNLLLKLDINVFTLLLSSFNFCCKKSFYTILHNIDLKFILLFPLDGLLISLFQLCQNLVKRFLKNIFCK